MLNVCKMPSAKNESSEPKTQKQTSTNLGRTSFFSRPSWSTILTVLFVSYILHSLWNVYRIYNPTPCPLKEKCIKPLWKKSTTFQMSVFVSLAENDWNFKHIWSADKVDISLPFEVELNVSLPQATLKNGSLFMHVFMSPSNGRGKLTSASLFDLSKTAVTVASLTKHLVRKTEAVNLLVDKRSDGENVKNRKQGKLNEKPVTHWIPRMSIHMMSEPIRLYGIPQEMYPYFRFNDNGQYLPILHADHFRVLEKDFDPVNDTTTVTPLEISRVPVSLGKMRLIVIVEHSLKMLKSAGFSHKETDDVKAIFFDTNIYLLFLTFLVSGFHLLFDVLAFKNDITFWRRRKTIVGLSFRSLIWRCISQSIVFVYLYDQQTSLLVLVPAGISVLIEFWKVTKALKLNISMERWRVRLSFGTVTEEEKQSDAYDSQGMKYLMWVVGPCCLMYAIYSLLYVKHVSWFSWFLESVVNGVYAFGFIFMMPQLFVNYKLKSVAHLPWKVFMYKAFNTVVDDLFAFIISMPTAHHIACFRDDIFFIVYLYQRWLYPVDKTRATEYSETAGAIDGKVKSE